MSTKATSRVAGEMTVRWTVELPEDNRYNGQACPCGARRTMDPRR